ncbi:formylmethanofuran dehydrogenase subunit B [Planctomycetes bacterium K23_9]|uniref:Formyltransferase/hydrolase complex Fhc subunit B n=1 Tax=Stieleria marina TaxID=1930275 RepID=A0A517P3H2_9BACT|nr:Formyltransferase/hydrolase complex Fhc subunit B [Planctomycetes bacterium K23_9]
MTQTFKNVVCPGCACLCDDVTLTLGQNELIDFQPGCSLGRNWFASKLQKVSQAVVSPAGSLAYADGIDRAADLLNQADYPLIYGLSRSSTPGQRAAVELGEALRGVVDTTASLCHGPSIMALQEFGEVTCTLGEVRNRADLVIFWGCNPADSHPRHAERYSVTAKGQLIPGGRADRKIVMIGSEDQIHQWRLDHNGTEPDLTIAVPKGKDFEMLSTLNRMVQHITAQGKPVDDVSDDFRTLMKMICDCHYGVFFFGLGLAETGSWGGTERTGIGHINVAALLHLVAELNAITRFTARRMRLQGDVSGADNVLCWQTAYPFAVDFSRGYPRYNPGEYTTNELLERGDVDAALLVGAETVQHLTSEAKTHLAKIPSVILDYPGSEKPFVADVAFTTAVYGLHAPGTAYRMDNVPLDLKKMVPSDLPTDETVLQDLLKKLKELDPTL